MKLDFRELLLDHKRKPIPADDDADHMNSYGDYATSALFANLPPAHPNTPPEKIHDDKVRSGKLGFRIQIALELGRAIDLASEDRTLCKQYVARVYSPMVVTRLSNWIEGKPQEDDLEALAAADEREQMERDEKRPLATDDEKRRAVTPVGVTPP